MNITTRTGLRHFLLKLLTEFENSKVEQLDHFFQSFFTKSELKDILKTIYDTKALKELKLGSMSKQDLLHIIGDNSQILGYFLDKWDEEICQNAALCVKGVENTLDQLQLPTHYLRYTKILEWDSNDLSNYRSLQIKAGKICRVYGIYDASIRIEDIESVTSSPLRFYDSKSLAKEAIQELIETGQFNKNDLHILPLFAGR